MRKRMLPAEAMKLKQWGKHRYDAEQYCAAIEVLSVYTSMGPRDSLGLFMLGDSLRCVGRKAEAEVALLQALECAPDRQQPIVHLRLALLYSEWGKHVLAEQAFSSAAMDGDFCNAAWFWIFRGANHLSDCHFTESEGCYRRAIVLEPENYEAFANLGSVLMAQGRYSDAKAAIDKALDLLPDYEFARTLLNSLEGVDEAMGISKEVRDRCA